MKITLSKKQWQLIGRKTGWLKRAQTSPEQTPQQTTGTLSPKAKEMLERKMFDRVEDILSNLEPIVKVKYDGHWSGKHYPATMDSPEEWPEYDYDKWEVSIEGIPREILFNDICDDIWTDLDETHSEEEAEMVRLFGDDSTSFYNSAEVKQIFYNLSFDNNLEDVPVEAVNTSWRRGIAYEGKLTVNLSFEDTPNGKSISTSIDEDGLSRNIEDEDINRE